MAQKTAISLLQEIMVKYKRPMPVYEMESVGNLLEPRFKCTVMADNVISEGVARTKKDAKQRAAEAALANLGFEKFTKLQAKSESTVVPEVTQPDGFIPNKNYIGELNEFASGSSIIYPSYEDPLYPENGYFKITCKFMDLETEGHACNKKEAKQIAAFKMAQIVKLRKTLPVRSIHKTRPLKVEITEDDKHVITRFENLTIKPKDRNDRIMNIQPNPNITERDYDIEAAKTEISNMGLNYELKKIQEDPYIVAIQLKHNPQRNFTLIGDGDTEEEATKKALNDTLEILREGCTFAFSDANQTLSA